MRKINLNKIITSKSKIEQFKKDKYYYLAIDNFLIIRFDRHDLFTAVSERKINERKKENERVYTLYNEIVHDDELQTTGFTNYVKHTRTDSFHIFKTENKFKFIDSKFINLLEDHVLDYQLESRDSPLTPLVARHKQEKISFVIMPIRMKNTEFEFELKENKK